MDVLHMLAECLPKLRCGGHGLGCRRVRRLKGLLPGNFAGIMIEICRKLAGKLPDICRTIAEHLPENRRKNCQTNCRTNCRKFAGKLPENCRNSAGKNAR